MLQNYIADRKFYRSLFLIVLPIILQFFIQHFINFLDDVMVGQLGEAEIAAVAVANQYYKVFYPSVVSICTASAIFTAQYFGSKKYRELQKVFGIKLTIPMFITTVFVLVGLFRTEDIIRIFIKDNEEAVRYGVQYLKIAIWSYIPLTISTAFTFTLRPLRQTHIPMIASSVGMITNLILNFFLIYGFWIFPALGVQGAAIGTVVARVIELLIYIIIFIKKDFPFKTNVFSYFILDFNITLTTFKKVIPLFINQVTVSLVMVAIFKIYSDQGDDSIVAVNIADKVRQVVYILVSGLGTSTSILVGQKLGNNELEEAEQNANYLLGYSVFMGFIILLVVSGSAFIVPHFYEISSSAKRLTTYAIMVHGFIAPVMMLTRIPFFVLRSGGRVVEVLMIHSLFMFFVRIPVALIFGYLFDLNLIALMFIVEGTRFLNAIISMYFYKQKKWLTNLT